jgi:hypothetical protein
MAMNPNNPNRNIDLFASTKPTTGAGVGPASDLKGFADVEMTADPPAPNLDGGIPSLGADQHQLRGPPRDKKHGTRGGHGRQPVRAQRRCKTAGGVGFCLTRVALSSGTKFYSVSEQVFISLARLALSPEQWAAIRHCVCVHPARISIAFASARSCNMPDIYLFNIIHSARRRRSTNALASALTKCAGWR